MTESCLTHLEHELMVSGPILLLVPLACGIAIQTETRDCRHALAPPLPSAQHDAIANNNTRDDMSICDRCSPSTSPCSGCRLDIALDILANLLIISRRSLPAAGQLDNLIYHTSAREENQGDLAEESYPPSN